MAFRDFRTHHPLNIVSLGFSLVCHYSVETQTKFFHCVTNKFYKLNPRGKGGTFQNWVTCDNQWKSFIIKVSARRGFSLPQ